MVLPSGAVFESEKMVTHEGTVKEFEYTDPHSWLYVVVRDDKGSDTGWGIEAEGPSALMRGGIRCAVARRPRHGASPSVARRPCGGRPGYGDQIATAPCSIHDRSRRQRLRTDVTRGRGFCVRSHGAKGCALAHPCVWPMIADINIADGCGRA
jgi:hypothetical protein